MLTITMTLLEQRLREVDAEIHRASLLPAVGALTYAQRKIVGELKSYRKQVMKELAVIDVL